MNGPAPAYASSSVSCSVLLVVFTGLLLGSRMRPALLPFPLHVPAPLLKTLFPSSRELHTLRGSQLRCPFFQEALSSMLLGPPTPIAHFLSEPLVDLSTGM